MVIALARRRSLRQHATNAEKLLWNRLRARQFFGLKFRRQHPVGPYIVDFYCAVFRVAVELDGGQHFTLEGRAYDEKRTAYLASYGIRVLRFSNRELFDELDGVLDLLRRACRTLRQSGRDASAIHRPMRTSSMSGAFSWPVGIGSLRSMRT